MYKLSKLTKSCESESSRISKTTFMCVKYTNKNMQIGLSRLSKRILSCVKYTNKQTHKYTNNDTELSLASELYLRVLFSRKTWFPPRRDGNRKYFLTAQNCQEDTSEFPVLEAKVCWRNSMYSLCDKWVMLDIPIGIVSKTLPPFPLWRKPISHLPTVDNNIGAWVDNQQEVGERGQNISPINDHCCLLKLHCSKLLNSKMSTDNDRCISNKSFKTVSKMPEFWPIGGINRFHFQHIKRDDQRVSKKMKWLQNFTCCF